MSYLLCARCDIELFDDPHTDTDLEDVCGGCCRVCFPVSAAGEREAVPATAPLSAADTPKATTNGAPVAQLPVSGGLSERTTSASAIAGEAQGSAERDRADQTMAATTAVTNEEATAQRDLPVA